jgi:hypothetical protein
MDKLRMNREAVEKITEGMNEEEIVKINSLYCDDRIIESFLTFVRNHRKEVFLYLQDQRWRRYSTRRNSISPSSHGC